LIAGRSGEVVVKDDAMRRGSTGRGPMSVIRTGGRAEEYIMAGCLPPHNYGVRPWGVGFEMNEPWPT
jgi:hypothetical protein